MTLGSPLTPLEQKPDSPQTGPKKTYVVAPLGKLVTGPRGRWVVLLVWIALTGLLSGLAPKLANLYDNNLLYDIGDQESVRGAKLLAREFPDQRKLPAIIVFHNPAGLSESDFAKAKQVGEWLVSKEGPTQVASVLSIFTLPQARSELVSTNGTTMSMVVSLNSSPADGSLTETVKEIRKYTDPLDGRGSPLQVKLTGPGGVAADTQLVFANTDLTLLLSTVALVLVLLIIIYRSPVLALLPLIAVGLAQSVVGGLLALGIKAEFFAVSQMASSIMTILLFGAGTDYTIFLVSRYREELQHEPDRIVALRNAFNSVAGAIISSAGTVIVALLSLALAVLGIYNSLGSALALALIVMLLAGLTLVPALLAILGRFAFWPFHPKPIQAQSVQTKSSFWGWIARWVAHHPKSAVVSSTVFLLILCLGNLGVSDVYNYLTGFRQSTASSKGYELLAANFKPGTLAPFDVVISLKDGTNAYQQLAAIEQVSQAIATVPDVGRVTGPTRPTGQPVETFTLPQLEQEFAKLPPSLTQAIRSAKSMPAAGGAGMSLSGLDPTVVGLYAQSVTYISNNNSTVRLQVTLNSDPYGLPALDSIAPIRKVAQQTARQIGLSENVALTGVTPELADTRQVSDQDKTIVIPVVVILTALILGILLRSLVAPIFLLIVVLLNFFAAVGVTSFLYTTIQGDDGRAYSNPLYTFIFLVALGADYTIFLMSRVREEIAKSDLVTGTQKALTSTGGVITSAGLILAGTFLVLTTLPLRDLYQLGITVAVGILLDTFVVRGLLVPGLVLLLGKVCWWPSKIKIN